MAMTKAKQAFKFGKRGLCILLSFLMVSMGVVFGGVIQTSAKFDVKSPDEAGTRPVYFYATETIYVRPEGSGAGAGTIESFANFNETVGANFGKPDNSITDKGAIVFSCVGASNVRIVKDGTFKGAGNEAESTYSPSGGGIGETEPGSYKKVTLNGNVAVTRGGMVRWKATFTYGGLQYEAYCYSYVRKPEPTALTGMIIGSSMQVGGGFLWQTKYFPYLMNSVSISGTHKQKVLTHASDVAQLNATPTHKGSGVPDSQMRKDVWSGTYDTAVTNGSVTLGDGNGAGHLESMAYLKDSTVETSVTDNNGKGIGTIGWAFRRISGTSTTESNMDFRAGHGTVFVDSSRYTNLNNVPQLKKHSALISLNGSGKGGQNTNQNPSHSQATSNDKFSVGNLSGIEYVPFLAGWSSINYAIPAWGTEEVELTYTYNGKWSSTANCTLNHTARTMLRVVAYDKTDMRTELISQITRNMQVSTADDSEGYAADYLTALDNLAAGVCNPGNSFTVNSAYDAYDSGNALGSTKVGGSLANLVENARKDIRPDGPYTARATYRSSITQESLVSGYITSQGYYVGGTVYAQYDADLNLRGYRPTPIGVNVPGSDMSSENGTYQDISIDENLTYRGYKIAIPDLSTASTPEETTAMAAAIADSGGSPQGYAATNIINSINNNISKGTAKKGLEWIWWMEPIEYQIKYLPGEYGDTNAEPMDNSVVQYDVQSFFKLCTYPAVSDEWVFDHWEIENVGHFSPGDEIDNLAYREGTVLEAVAIWTKVPAEARRLYLDPNGGTFVSANARRYLDGTTSTPYSNLHSSLPAVTRVGYTFSHWAFDRDGLISWDLIQTYTMSNFLPKALDEDEGSAQFLYAIWKPVNSTITYNQSFDFSEGGGSVVDSVLVEYGQSATIETVLDHPAGTASGLYRNGYTFIGWGYSKNGAVTSGVVPSYEKLFAAGGKYSYEELFGDIPGAPETRVLALKAVWVPERYVISFYENWHNLNSTYDPESPSYDLEGFPDNYYFQDKRVYNTSYGVDADATALSGLREAQLPTPPPRKGWQFAGWSTNPNTLSDLTRVTEDTSFKPTVAQMESKYGVQLYARWVSGPNNPFDVYIDPDNGFFMDGTSDKRRYEFGQGTKVSIKDLNVTRPGYTLLRWVFTNESTSEYNDKDQTLWVLDEVHLKAIWQKKTYTILYTDPDEKNLDVEFTVTIDDALKYPTDYEVVGKTLDAFELVSDTIKPDRMEIPLKITMAEFLATYAEEGKPKITMKACWKVNGGLPPDDKIPDDVNKPIPEEPGDWLEPFDPDGNSGYILLYLTAPKDVQVDPDTRSVIFLEYGKKYVDSFKENGADWPVPTRTDGKKGEWRIIKYGSDGASAPPLGELLNPGDKCEHAYSIWIAPFFEDGFSVRFDANGGTIASTEEKEEGGPITYRIVYPGESYGEAEFGFPTVEERKNYEFLGWYTEPDGGVRVTATTLVTDNGRPIFELQGSLVPIDQLPVADVLFARWVKTTTGLEDAIENVKGWLSSDSLANLPNWANLTLMGIGLPLLGYSSAALGAITTLPAATMLAAGFLGLLVFPLALMLPFLFPVIGALMPVWWPALLLI